jgi:hypothetical protein
VPATPKAETGIRTFRRVTRRFLSLPLSVPTLNTSPRREMKRSIR